MQPHNTRLSELVKPRISLIDVANRAGCSYSFVAKVSAGTRNPNEAIKRAVEDLFGVPWRSVFPEQDGADD